MEHVSRRSELRKGSRTSRGLLLGFNLLVVLAVVAWLLPVNLLPGGLGSVEWRSLVGPERGSLSPEQVRRFEGLLSSLETDPPDIGDEAPHYEVRFRPRYGPPMILTAYSEGRVKVFRSGLPLGRTVSGTNSRLTEWFATEVRAE